MRKVMNMMDQYFYILSFTISFLLSIKPTDEDFIDRLNRKYTVHGLLILTVFLDMHLLSADFSSKISCWNRANFPPAHVNFTNMFCFVTNMYRLDADETFSDERFIV